jgi:hypothetical protein
MSNTRITLSASVMSIRPDMLSSASSSAAWIAATATIAPPLSFALRSDRYIASGQRDAASAVAVGPNCGTSEGKRGSANRCAASGVPPLGEGSTGQRLELALRPPPWLDLPPLLAISRCLAGSIAANPRFAPVLLVCGIFFLPIVSGTAARKRAPQQYVSKADRG